MTTVHKKCSLLLVIAAKSADKTFSDWHFRPHSTRSSFKKPMCM